MSGVGADVGIRIPLSEASGGFWNSELNRGDSLASTCVSQLITAHTQIIMLSPALRHSMDVNKSCMTLRMAG